VNCYLFILQKFLSNIQKAENDLGPGVVSLKTAKVVDSRRHTSHLWELGRYKFVLWVRARKLTLATKARLLKVLKEQSISK